ncbi:hypothetical protein FHX49_000922 [Microbacterium endophyticum]|uniref:Amidohydrolase 3 domain-containing protein n=1 Tax=Microbacterium endophyticum TaxID=1526412 RepID=A0A7W4YN57_9MICO|nr:amidohydrolase family protein [Microbacterium endophyticum]MBB2975356.1 hypothetical protein [Microbacterium endophyticum]NIK35625.1 hypothetical protein [Microbacterium endophyticum]
MDCQERIVIAPVLTMDPECPRAEAMGIIGDRIKIVGTYDEVRAAMPDDADEVHHEGVVLPGLIDAHLHMERGGLKALGYAPGIASVDELISEMAERFDDDDWPGEDEPTLEQRVDGLRLVQPFFHALGITGVVDPATTPDEMRGYQEAHRSGYLTMRTVAMPYLEVGSDDTPDVDAVIARLSGTGVSTGFGDDMLRIGPIKVYADGEALKGQAFLEEPWDDGGYVGLQRISDDDLARLVSWCGEHDWGVGTHAVGGAAVAAVIAAYRKAGSAITDRRFQLIHAYLEPSAQSIAAAAELGIVASLQPSIIWHNGRGLRKTLGDRAEVANPVRSWLDAGAIVAFGSDGPFFAFDPRHLMWQTVTRRVANEDQPLSATEAITMGEALAAYTTGAAYASFAEHSRGMLRAGMYADWALWSDDPTAVSVDAVRELRVLHTEVGGRCVYSERSAK